MNKFPQNPVLLPISAVNLNAFHLNSHAMQTRSICLHQHVSLTRRRGTVNQNIEAPPPYTRLIDRATFQTRTSSVQF